MFQPVNRVDCKSYTAIVHSASSCLSGKWKQSWKDSFSADLMVGQSISQNLKWPGWGPQLSRHVRLTSGWSTDTLWSCCEHIPSQILTSMAGNKTHPNHSGAKLPSDQTYRIWPAFWPTSPTCPWGILHCRFAVLHPSSSGCIPVNRLSEKSFAVSYIWSAFRG